MGQQHEVNIEGGPVKHTGPGTGPLILGLTWAFCGLSIIAVSLRMWLRRRIGHAWDDWLMVLATGMMIVYCSVLSVSIRWGLARSYESITLPEYRNILYYQILAQFFLNLQPVFSRWSIAVFLIRIFGKTRAWFRYFLIFWVALMALTAVLANIFTFTVQDPLESYWDPTIDFTYRFSPTVQYYIAVGLVWEVAISDLAFAIIPVYFVWSLQLATAKKLGLAALLSGSLVAFLATLAKLIFSTMQIRGETGQADGPTTGGVLWITSGIEQGLVIVLGSVPAFGSLAQLQLANSRVVQSLMYLVTLGRTSRRSSNATRSSSAYHDEIGMGTPHRLSDGDRQSNQSGSVQKPARFADGTLTTIDGDMAKYIKRTDEFVLVNKDSQGQLR